MLHKKAPFFFFRQWLNRLEEVMIWLWGCNVKLLPGSPDYPWYKKSIVLGYAVTMAVCDHAGSERGGSIYSNCAAHCQGQALHGVSTRAKCWRSRHKPPGPGHHLSLGLWLWDPLLHSSNSMLPRHQWSKDIINCSVKTHLAGILLEFL